jgi:hypothetical protein
MRWSECDRAKVNAQGWSEVSAHVCPHVVVPCASDPLFTMERLKQLVATYGNGFGLFLRLRASGDLLLIATSCNHGAP